MNHRDTAMLILTGYVHVAPVDIDDFLADIQALTRSGRRREGNLLYAVAMDDRDIGRLLVVERWRDQASLSTHLNASETVEFVARWQGRMTAEILKYDATNERPLMDK